MQAVYTAYVKSCESAEKIRLEIIKTLANRFFTTCFPRNVLSNIVKLLYLPFWMRILYFRSARLAETLRRTKSEFVRQTKSLPVYGALGLTQTTN